MPNKLLEEIKVILPHEWVKYWNPYLIEDQIGIVLEIKNGFSNENVACVQFYPNFCYKIIKISELYHSTPRWQSLWGEFSPVPGTRVTRVEHRTDERGYLTPFLSEFPPWTGTIIKTRLLKDSIFMCEVKDDDKSITNTHEDYPWNMIPIFD